MKSLSQQVVMFLIGAVLAIVSLWLLKPKEPEPVEWWLMDNAEMEVKVATGTDNTVRDYIAWNERREWKPMDAVPGYIANAGSYKSAIAAINVTYPKFGGVEAKALLDSIRTDPLAYRAYCFDLLAASRFYRQ